MVANEAVHGSDYMLPTNYIGIVDVLNYWPLMECSMDLLKRTYAGIHDLYYQLSLSSFCFSPSTGRVSRKYQNVLFDEEKISRKRRVKFGGTCHQQHANYCQKYACIGLKVRVFTLDTEDCLNYAV